MALKPDQPTQTPPPGRGISLGWRLALSTAMVIGLVMGGILIAQQLVDLKHKRQMHQQLIEMSMAPLAVRLETAETLDAMVREIDEFHLPHGKKGYSVHELFLLDATNEPTYSTLETAGGENGFGYLKATIPIVSSLLNGGKGQLMALRSSEEYRDSVRRDWILWFVHFIVTICVVFLFLAVVIYFQVTKPVNRLIRGVQKMEKGYWGAIDLTGGAWEIRWLAWRFSNMVQEVQNTMTHLFEAEQKARSLTLKQEEIPPKEDQEASFESAVHETDKESVKADSSDYRRLLAVCEKLEAISADDPRTVLHARNAWKKEAAEANRLGFHQIKARLEDATLHLMEPNTYTSLNEHISQFKSSWKTWLEQGQNELRRLLEDQGIPCAGVLHRVKHTAGVWTKMQSKGLDLDEIHDLFAFRIIVPTEADCYAALGIIHRHYRPVVSRFKGYITKPKKNGYRSLHSCVSADDGPVFEIQIRSVAMNLQAENGDASHWLYKKDGHETDHKFAVAQWWLTLTHRNKKLYTP